GFVDEDGDRMVVMIVDDDEEVASFTLQSNSNNGSFIYSPPAGFVGVTSFTYRIWDGFEFSAEYTAEITVTNAAPVDVDEHTYDIAHDDTLSAPAAIGVLSSPYDDDG